MFHKYCKRAKGVFVESDQKPYVVEPGERGTTLVLLNLSWNGLIGSVPKSLGGLKAANFIDLSHNGLNGIISSEIGGAAMLEELRLDGVDFRRWQKKMHFLLSSMSVVYVFTTPIPEDGGDDATVKQIRKRNKWDNDDYVCRGLILKGMFDLLFDIY
nr:zinc finger, CCHC-type [Tanacetum cinerariifolium]